MSVHDWWKDRKWVFVNKYTCKPMRFNTCNRCDSSLHIARVHEHYETVRLAIEGEDEVEELYILSNDLHLADTECLVCNIRTLRWVKEVQE